MKNLLNFQLFLVIKKVLKNLYSFDITKRIWMPDYNQKIFLKQIFNAAVCVLRLSSQSPFLSSQIIIPFLNSKISTYQEKGLEYQQIVKHLYPYPCSSVVFYHPSLKYIINSTCRIFLMFSPIINGYREKAHGNDSKCRFIKNTRILDRLCISLLLYMFIIPL